MVVEGVLSALVLILAIVTTVAVILGLGGAIGVVRFLRCEHCGRLNIVAGPRSRPTCVYCRHERLFHPVHHSRSA